MGIRAGSGLQTPGSGPEAIAAQSGIEAGAQRFEAGTDSRPEARSREPEAEMWQI
jgi:hypothetical protein